MAGEREAGVIRLRAMADRTGAQDEAHVRRIVERTPELEPILRALSSYAAEVDAIIELYEQS